MEGGVCLKKENQQRIKICVVTATRAEYGILKPLIRRLEEVDGWDTQLVVTGAHLVGKLGDTYQEIEQDGIRIHKKIPINTEGNTEFDISQIMANALVGFGRYFQEERPDLLVVLGDRTELLAICLAAVNAHVPIAHIHGGELTFGAVDDCMRHAITKLSHLHFAAAEEYRNRIIQMGEEPGRVFNVGALGVENIRNEELMTQEALGEDVGFPASQDYVVVTFQPVTLEWEQVKEQVQELFAAMRERAEFFYLVTKANADAGGDLINQFMEQETAKFPNMKLVSSLGMKRYLSAVNHARFVLGNSSSGVIEAPALGTPTVNIGSRQDGRILANSVICCKPERSSILNAMDIAMYMAHGVCESPYGNGGTSRQIIQILKRFFQGGKICLGKKFYDIKWEADNGTFGGNPGA